MDTVTLPVSNAWNVSLNAAMSDYKHWIRSVAGEANPFDLPSTLHPNTTRPY